MGKRIVRRKTESKSPRDRSAGEARIGFADQMRASVHRAGFASRHSLEARSDPGACSTCHAPDRCASCHTARVDGYYVEGHVPAADIQKMLKERPKITGIAAPGMPIGSPGMEQGGRTENYSIVAFDKSGKQTVFERR